MSSRTRLGLLLFGFVFAHSALGQGSPKGLRYVLPNGPGAMVISTEGLQPQTLSLLGKGSRLAAQFDKTGSDLVLSY
ncbi:MAG TPA: hypothetical protein VKV02_00360, partial [Acidobacteriaceae bacterium]|nr:hypothetical protein [Acidobacteriaceae bacterium]